METPKVYPHDRALGAEVSDELPTDPAPLVDSSRPSCSAPSAPLGSAQDDQSARADEVPMVGSAAAAAATYEDEDYLTISRSELRDIVKYYVESLDDPDLEQLVG